MFGTFFDKITGLFDRRFVLGLLLPTFAFFAGAGALVATDLGWTQTISWWQHLSASRQVTLAIATAAGLVFAATVLGTQVVAITRVFEGYWRWGWADKTIGAVGRRWQRRQLTQLAKDTSAMGYLREYLAFAPAELGAVLPTRLGNTLRAAESYPGDPERWGLDAVFWWPRLYLIIPDSARAQVDEARASMDQMVVLSALSVMFAAVAVGFGIAGLPLVVWVPCAGGGLALSWLVYRAAVTSAGVFGDLVRSCFDLFRGDLLTRLGWPLPGNLPDERALWGALGQQLYRRGTNSRDQELINAPRADPNAALQRSDRVRPGRLRQFLHHAFGGRSSKGLRSPGKMRRPQTLSMRCAPLTPMAQMPSLIWSAARTPSAVTPRSSCPEDACTYSESSTNEDRLRCTRTLGLRRGTERHANSRSGVTVKRQPSR